VILVIKEATGAISKSFIKYPSNIHGKHIKELQKTAILATAHTYCGQFKYKMSVKGNNIRRSIHCKNEIAATFYTSKTWFVSGM
jgi:hypothetical protein